MTTNRNTSNPFVVSQDENGIVLDISAIGHALANDPETAPIFLAMPMAEQVAAAIHVAEGLASLAAMEAELDALLSGPVADPRFN